MRLKQTGRVAGTAAIFFALLSLRSNAHDVITTRITFSREIVRLLQSRCINCHHTGGMAFSLQTYAEARPWATAIKEEVLERRMPPWGAVKGFGEFRDDQGLTQEEVDLVSEWVEGGVPEGEPTLLPKPWEPSVKAAAQHPSETPVAGKLILKTAATFSGVRPKEIAKGASLMVTARRPDGSVEPLLWLYQYDPRFAHPYWFRSAVRLPAGTAIEVSEAGVVALLTAAATSGPRPSAAASIDNRHPGQ